jgi:GalNAc-alpha-(1->4)-GalNAc-alpha-(1->3)-diNAcBac-PP-undecaprenol alpha-1,4-N-acetyl-D-galactosaminyltransferase
MTSLAPMRITMVMSSLLPGGAERVAVELLDQLGRRGHNLTLVTLAARETDVLAAPQSVRRVALDLVGESSGRVDAVRRNLRRVISLRRSVLASDPDVVLAFQTSVNVTTLVALSRTGLPVVVSERVDPRAHHLPRPWSALRRACYRRAVALVVQTVSLRAWGTREMKVGRVEVVPNPVAVPPATQTEAGVSRAGEERTVLLAVGRLERQKGFDLLVSAFARIAEEAAEWDLVVLGEGSCRGALESQVQRLGLTGRVRLPGFCPDVSGELARADAFVLSSRYEGFPNALLEAMAHGLPVVAARCPSGPEEMVDDGRTGLLATCGSVDDLAMCLRRLLLDPVLREQLGTAALEVRSRFALQPVVDQWEALLESVVR